MKNRKQATIVCCLALAFSLVCAALGFGFVAGSQQLSFGLRWASGFAFAAVPLLLVQLLIQIRRKDT